MAIKGSQTSCCRSFNSQGISGSTTRNCSRFCSSHCAVRLRKASASGSTFRLRKPSQHSFGSLRFSLIGSERSSTVSGSPNPGDGFGRESREISRLPIVLHLHTHRVFSVPLVSRVQDAAQSLGIFPIGLKGRIRFVIQQRRMFHVRLANEHRRRNAARKPWLGYQQRQNLRKCGFAGAW